MKKSISVILTILLTFPLVCSCKCKKEVDYSAANGYLTSIIDKIESLDTPSFTYSKEEIEYNKAGNEVEKKIVVSTYDNILDAYLLKDNQDDNSFKYLTYKLSNKVYVWEDNEENGLIVNYQYPRYLIKLDFDNHFSFYSAYKGLNKQELIDKISKTKKDTIKTYQQENKTVKDLKIEIDFKQLKDDKYQLIYEYEIVSNEDKIKTSINEKYVVEFNKEMISSYISNREEEVIKMNEQNEVIETKYSNNKKSMTITNQYDKTIYSKVTIPSSFPKNEAEHKIYAYVDGVLEKPIECEMGKELYSCTNYGKGPYSDETYLVENDPTFMPSYSDFTGYYIDKIPDISRAKIVTVYLYQDDDELIHKKTTYEYVKEGRYVPQLELDGVTYDDKILVNHKEINYQSFGVTKQKIYIVHCYAYAKN